MNQYYARIHSILNNNYEIEKILQRFFKEELTRYSVPKIQNNENQESFTIACSIYKRGFINQLKPDLKVFIPKLYHLSENETYLFFQEDSSLKFYVIDENVYLNHKSYFSNINHNNLFLIQATEKNKSWQTVLFILKKILTIKSISEMITIGGGITLDLGSFVAGLLDIPLCSFPTTILAAVDACVGGKTGVNYPPFGKNQVGLFYAPKAFYLPLTFFSSLPHKEFLCGLAECLKHSYLYGNVHEDSSYFENILSNKKNSEVISNLIEKNYYYKKQVVEKDPFETRGIRQILNFGHTVAHVLETLAYENYLTILPHGIAVALGMLFLIQYSFVQVPQDFTIIIKNILKEYPIKLNNFPKTETIRNLLKEDKKNKSSNKVELIIPEYGFMTVEHNFLRKSFHKSMDNYDVAKMIVEFLDLFVK